MRPGALAAENRVGRDESHEHTLFEQRNNQVWGQFNIDFVSQRICVAAVIVRCGGDDLGIPDVPRRNVGGIALEIQKDAMVIDGFAPPCAGIRGLATMLQCLQQTSANEAIASYNQERGSLCHDLVLLCCHSRTSRAMFFI